MRIDLRAAAVMGHPAHLAGGQVPRLVERDALAFGEPLRGGVVDRLEGVAAWIDEAAPEFLLVHPDAAIDAVETGAAFADAHEAVIAAVEVLERVVTICGHGFILLGRSVGDVGADGRKPEKVTIGTAG